MKPVLAKLRSAPAPLRIIAFALILMLLWLPIALPLRWLIRDPNWVSIVTLVILYAQFIWLVQVWGNRVHHQPHVLRSYGLILSRQNGLLVLRGFGIGLGSVLILLAVQTAVGWIHWQSPTPGIVRIGLEGLLVALAFGFAEELLFRGWMLDELERDYVAAAALWVNAILFAALHLRLWTFPSLVLLGIALVWAKRSHSETRIGRRYNLLGLPIGLHAGLVYGNYVVEVGQLIQYSDRVPAWVTGIDRNPLAGLIGFIFMAGLALGMQRYVSLHSGQASSKL